MPETPDSPQAQPITPDSTGAATPTPEATPATPPASGPPVMDPNAAPRAAEAMGKAQAGYQRATEIEQQSTAPPPPGPHARLMAMVQGLAVGVGAFAGSA